MGNSKDYSTDLKKIAIIGLGYVGLPLAIAFSEKFNVVGYDINEAKIQKYRNGIDPTGEMGDEKISESKIHYTSDVEVIRGAEFYIVTVPTPIHSDKTPDLNAILGATEIVAGIMKKESVVIYESTVYPGVTEDICIPLLEEQSGMKCGKDFTVGYSPERINPGDKVHELKNIRKIVSGINEKTCECIAGLYDEIIENGTYRAESIKVAEAAKVAENAQRDINIAFINELAMIFDRMQINTNSVIEAMNTKWNALRFYPGLVGGHCIGIDPYYFLYEAQKLGFHSQIMSAGRKINDDMSRFIVEATIKMLIKMDKPVKDCKLYLLGLTFKENCLDLRNSKVFDIYKGLKELGIEPIISDPVADQIEVKEIYQKDMISSEKINDADCIILAVSHQQYKNLTMEKLKQMYKKDNHPILIDVKSIFSKDDAEREGIEYWNL
ncbi:nucleotide sugar dehydrogenase [Eubacteriaceae bacterium ES2]|nr:nucleotide sugar dehydrogenase [Eubacteriaceae bacterium ES2]